MPIPSGSEPVNLVNMISRLEADRQRHAEAIREIDRVLSQVGRAVGAFQDNHSDDPAGSQQAFEVGSPRRERKRGRFQMTGERSVLELIRRQGNPTTAEVNAHWRAEGRRGSANVILLRLLKTGQIARQADPRVRGSRYVLSDQATGDSAEMTMSNGGAGSGQSGGDGESSVDEQHDAVTV